MIPLPTRRIPKSISAIQSSLSLLGRRQRVILALLTLVQMVSAFMDLAGVLFIGLVAAQFTGSLTGLAPDGAQISGPQSVEVPWLGATDLASLLLMAALLLLGKSVISITLTRISLSFLAHQQARISETLFHGLLGRFSVHEFGNSSQNYAFALTNGVGFATVIVLGQSQIFLSEIALLVVLSAGLIILDPTTTVLSLIFFGCIALVLHFALARRSRRLGSLVSNTEIQSIADVQQTLVNYQFLKVARRLARVVMDFARTRTISARAQANLSFIGQLPKFGFDVALVLGAALLIGSQVLFNDLTSALTVVALFLAAGSRVLPSLLRLQGALLAVNSGAARAGPTYSLAQDLGYLGIDVSTTDTPITSAPISASTHLGTSVQLSQVNFAYRTEFGNVLSDITLQIAPGESCAFVGPTGAGKSTLAQVVLGLIAPNSGTVLLNGTSPNHLLDTHNGLAAYVPQDVQFFNSSVRTNICLGLDPALVDDDSVWRVLRAVDLEDLFRQRADGLASLIGERGVNLSGGQRQRLGLARALLQKPRLLVLDEATSALDARSEEKIGTSLQEMAGDVTQIIIAHRLSTVKACDQVIFLSHGKIHGRGTFTEVREQSKEFDAQARMMGL